jgi:cell division protein ZapA
MADKIRIRIAIADRLYPMLIDPSQEEGMRKAQRKINKMLKFYEDNYEVQDKQDVIAMCLIQLATEFEVKDYINHDENTLLDEKLKTLDSLLDLHLEDK